MINASTIEQLRAMKFSAMAAAFEQQLKEPKSYSQLGFEERFGLMVDAEWNRRQDNKLRRRVRDARLDIPSASMEGIEYIPDRGLDKQQLLRLATCAYLRHGFLSLLFYYTSFCLSGWTDRGANEEAFNQLTVRAVGPNGLRPLPPF